MTQELRRLEADVGELLESRTGGDRDFSTYEHDPVGFIRDVLQASPWRKQEDVARALIDHALVTVRSCHAAGKDWLAARLALWWVYARRGLVFLTGPTQAQVEEILMRKELREAFVRARLPGELHVKALRPGGAGEAGVVAKTASGLSALTGFHAARVLVVVTEAQDPDLSHAWDAAFACATGADDRILTLGNPTEPDGRFHAAHQPGSSWHRVRIQAADVPNVARGETVVSGLLTQEGVERFRREYGEESPFYISRVLAQFPVEATDGLVRRAWIDEAQDPDRLRSLEETDLLGRGPPYVLGVDPARLGPDTTAVCLRQGHIVRRFETWGDADTMETAGRVRDLAARLIHDGERVSEVHVDEVGLGAGVLDRLARTLPALEYVDLHAGLRQRLHRRRPTAHGFAASRSAGLPDRFRNLRAQGYWHVRKRLEEGSLALPADERLAEELLATRVRFGADGRTEIESKDAVKGRLGRSPDLADALVVSLAPDLKHPKRRKIDFR